MNQFTPDPINYQWVDSDDQLAKLVKRCLTADWVAIDTEFVRTNTYYPIIGLIQLALDEEFFLIDPLAIKQTQPLKDLLSHPQVVKVMHACSEDLEVFQRYLGMMPEPLFDTQIAAAVLGHGLSAGYKTLVEEIYQVSLPKGEQRSDWLQRPLSESQKDYAVLDVVYLADIYQQQLVSLKQLDRLTWVEQDCQNLLAKQRQQTPPEQQYRRIKGAGTLTGEQLQILQALATWREQEVEQRNIPRGFLLKDLVMVELARRQPDSMPALAEVEQIHPRVLRKDGQQILDIIAVAVARGGSLETLDTSLSREAKLQLKQMQGLIAAKAKLLNVPPELMMSRKLMVTCLLNYLATGKPELPAGLTPWKRVQIETDLMKLMASFSEQGS